MKFVALAFALLLAVGEYWNCCFGITCTCMYSCKVVKLSYCPKSFFFPPHRLSGCLPARRCPHHAATCPGCHRHIPSSACGQWQKCRETAWGHTVRTVQVRPAPVTWVRLSFFWLIRDLSVVRLPFCSSLGAIYSLLRFCTWRQLFRSPVSVLSGAP